MVPRLSVGATEPANERSSTLRGSLVCLLCRLREGRERGSTLRSRGSSTPFTLAVCSCDACGEVRWSDRHPACADKGGSTTDTASKSCNASQYLLRGYNHLDHDQQDLGGKSLDFTGRWRLAHACCFVDQLAWIARGRPLSQTLSCFRITMRTRPCFWIP